NATAAAPLVKAIDQSPLFPLRVIKAGMPRMLDRSADVARVGAVVLEDAAASLFKKLMQLSKIIFTPGTAKAGRVFEASTAGFGGFGVDGIVFEIDRTAGEE